MAGRSALASRRCPPRRGSASRPSRPLARRRAASGPSRPGWTWRSCSAATASQVRSWPLLRCSRRNRTRRTPTSTRRWRETSAAAVPTPASAPRSSARPQADMARRPRVSRREFLSISAAVGGGLLLGFELPAPPPSSFSPNAFIRIDRDGRVTLIMHKVEMGQGTYTSMSMLLAEELEVDLGDVRLEHAPPDDARYAEPLFGVQETGGSTSLRGNWEPLRRAGAAARSLLVAAAAATWNVDPASCHAARGSNSRSHESLARLRRAGR